ncbi:MAG: nitroimidazol reductase NimA-like FMN-containing flavoprotein [Candidatus Azotimanducaceae bacterium]|jgi:nitroimidazol reductase NimA-like FMN-containing flavoprotein (pyridoxamine 5'-phosphate oxidase superfamily)
MSQLLKTDLTTIKRAPDRGSYDMDTIHTILDATPLCHVGYVVNGQPIVTPTIHWRECNRIYWHGSRISRTLVESEQAPVCLTVTHLDGLVLARSAFHHSANYRSVMIFGTPTLVEERVEKTAALTALIDKMLPGRWQTLREMTEKEFAATSVLSLPLSEASAKIRAGGPNDLDSDLDFPVWAGVLPLTTVTGNPEPCPHNQTHVMAPNSLQDYRIG